MSLFHHKIIEATLGKHAPATPEARLTLLQNWKQSIDSGLLLKQNEVAVHAPLYTKHHGRCIGLSVHLARGKLDDFP